MAAEKRPKPATVAKSVLYIRGLRTDLKDKFSSWCRLRGSTMKAEIETLMEKAITSPAK